MAEENREVTHVDEMFLDYYLDYASYVSLDRAVPYIEDGLKPVQRRILHAMHEMDDGRYNKVANIVGNTMRYHPHGDRSIEDALVGLGQKGLLIDTQGNWGNILTGDPAAASRYIEARLTPFAKEVVFNGKTTEWTLSYDTRSKEPVNLPVKFPLLLFSGVEGIGVALATEILPHNFNELIDASIAYLRNKPFALFPDFQTGGMLDATNYNDGKHGARVKVRARIEQVKKYQLRITELPWGVTTTRLCESIVSANEKGKIKIQNVVDNTAKCVDIVINLHNDMPADTAVEALYAFTQCEVSYAPNACVVVERKPRFLSVSDILRMSAEQTRDLIRRELEIRLGELADKWHLSSLERIFIENRIYRDIEEKTTWDQVVEAVWDGLKPHLHLLRRDVTNDDVLKLLEIRIKRISKYDAFKAEEFIQSLEAEIEEVNHYLSNLTQYTISYFKELKKRYGKGRERKAEITEFERVVAQKVAVANNNLYLNRRDGFVGYGAALRREANIGKCSTMDDLIVFTNEGILKVMKVQEKSFIGKNPQHVAVFDKEDNITYCMMYRDGRDGPLMVKKFHVGGVTRDREYDMTNGKPGSRVFFFSAEKNPEKNPKVKIYLHPDSKARTKEIEYDFADVEIKSRNVKGNIATKHKTLKVSRMMRDLSDLFDENADTPEEE